MAKNMKSLKTINLPKPSIDRDPAMIKRTLPYNGNAVTEKSFAFSFACFDREHELFNLGHDSSDGGVVSGNWFLDLIDCFKNVCNCNIYDLKTSMHDLHPIDWEKTNATPPQNYEQLDFKQFRINKSKGRVIGFSIDNIFYVMWFDPHHNLTDSDGYGTATYYYRPQSQYEQNVQKIKALEEENQYLKGELKSAEELLFGK
jgi:hypothetical protein